MLILYADDDGEDLGFFTEILKAAAPEAECIYAKDGREALEVLDTAVITPDYIFLDINMPFMDGRTCLKEIRKDSRFAGIPVIIYTTSTDPKEKALCMELGATAYFFKPTTIEKGVNTLSEFFKEHGR